ncbi:hypothetical protein [Phenylobacterium sp.]|uniref:hypothetical protein n=1 Tax=Phenylobacterium sp. TaxID=1871053 RepID=UPI0035B09B2F
MLLAFLAVLAAGTPAETSTSTATAAATAEAPAAAAAAQQTASADTKKPEMVCHQEEVTGSRFTKKVCRSKADIESEKADDQQALRNMQRMTGPRGN